MTAISTTSHRTLTIEIVSLIGSTIGTSPFSAFCGTADRDSSMQQGKCENLPSYVAGIAACFSSQATRTVMYVIALPNLPRRANVTISHYTFRTTFPPHFLTYFNQLLSSTMHPYCSPFPTPGLEALTHKVPLTLFSSIGRYVLKFSAVAPYQA